MESEVVDTGFLGDGCAGVDFPLFPRGRMTLLMGDPGVGKSLVAVHLAARHSVRSAMVPEAYGERRVEEEGEGGKGVVLRGEENPGMALIYSREDDADTLAFRLEVAAAGRPVDERFVRVMEYASLVPPALTRESVRKGRRSELMEGLEEIVEGGRGKIGLIVLDPLPAFLEGQDATHNPALIRRALNPLVDFAYRQNARVVGVCHLAKGRARSAVHQMAHSQAYGALARSVVLVTEDTETGDPRRRFLVPVKNSFALAEQAYGLRIESGRSELAGGRHVPWVRFEEGVVRRHPFLRGGWLGEEAGVGKLDLEEAVEMLQVVLRRGPMESKRVLGEARSLGITARTLKRAKQVMGVKAFRGADEWWVGMGEGAEWEI